MSSNGNKGKRVAKSLHIKNKINITIVFFIFSSSKTFQLWKAFIIQLQKILPLLGIHTVSIGENICNKAKKI